MHFEGDIGEIDLMDRLVDLWRETFTGAIRFENDAIIKIIYFKGGDIISASTNDRADSVDEILMRAGKVNREHVKQALAKRKETETLGDALLGLGFITRKELTWARRVQVIGVIRSIADWTSGSFTIVADYLPKREEGTLFSFPQLLVELVVTDPERSRFDKALKGGELVLGKAPDFADQFDKLGLNEEAEQVVAAVDGRRSAEEVANYSGKDTFNVYKLLHALRLLRLLKVEIPAARGGGADLSLDEHSLDDTFPKLEKAASMGFQTEDDSPGRVLLTPTSDDDYASTSDFDSGPDYPSVGTGFESPPASSELGAASFDKGSSFDSDSSFDSGLSFDSSADVPIMGSGSDYEPASAEVPPMPSWDSSAAPASSTNATTPPKTAEAALEQWGFDEAQIDEVRKVVNLPPSGRQKTLSGALAPPFARPVKRKRPVKGIVAAIAIVVLGAGGFFAYQWWQERTAAESAPVETLAAPPRPPLRPATNTATETTTETSTAPQIVSTSGVTMPRVTDEPPPVTTTTATTVPPTPTSTQAPPPTPTPVVASAPRGNEALRQRYDAMAAEYARNPTGNYTVQFELVCQPASVTKAIQNGGNKVWFLGTQYRGGSCYRVFWGRYQTQAEASAAMGEIPKVLRGAAPVVVRVPR